MICGGDIELFVFLGVSEFCFDVEEVLVEFVCC